MPVQRELCRRTFLEFRQVHDQMMKVFSKKTAQVGATPAQVGVLRCIPLDGKLSMSDLIRQVGCAPSNMTAIIQRMERDNLVQTAKNPQDQRENLVCLTEKGKDMRNSLDPVYQEFLQDVFGRLTEEELEVFRSILAKLKNSINAS